MKNPTVSNAEEAIKILSQFTQDNPTSVIEILHNIIAWENAKDANEKVEKGLFECSAEPEDLMDIMDSQRTSIYNK